jgi:hypothetical protein
MTQAERIVRLLAALDPTGIVDIQYGVPSDPSTETIEGCVLCKAQWHGPKEDWKHERGCPWSMARVALGMSLEWSK